MTSTAQIFCALDTADLDQAVRWARDIGPVTGGLKLGMEFVYSFGPQGIDRVQEACPDAAYFIDLKFHDIPNTVAGVVRSMTRQFRPAYLNVHAAGGPEMMKAAKDACEGKTQLLGVTILTSLNDEELQKIGYSGDVAGAALRLALLAQQSGMDGVVCSAHEIEALRKACGNDFKLMVPGIRPAGAESGDQKRVMTPKQAIQKGASHLVIGRPITSARDPVAAAQAIMDEISQ